MQEQVQSYVIGGLGVRFYASAPQISQSMSMAFSLSMAKSELTEGAEVLDVHAGVHEDGEFLSAMPEAVRAHFDDTPEDENPSAYLAADGSLVAVVRSKGSASYAMADGKGGRINLICQRLTRGKAPMHFQSVLVPALKHAYLMRGRLLLHAGCLEGPAGQGVLIVGLSGQGKTTTCISLALAGFRYVSDDLLVAGLDHEGHASALGIREKMNLTKKTVMMFEELHKYKSGFKLFGGAPKLPVDPYEVFGAEGQGRFSQGVRIRHLLTLERGGAAPALLPQPAEAILNHIIQNHTFEICRGGQRAVSAKSMDIIWAMLKGAKVWKLVTGPDPVGLGKWMHGQMRELGNASK